MQSKTLKIVLGVVLLALLGYGLYQAKRREVPDQSLLDQALFNVTHESPETAKLYDALVSKGLITQVTAAKLNGVDLGQTAISSDGSCTIRVDVEDVRRCMDRLEPVLAHEIFHAYDANFNHTPAEFIANVQVEKGSGVPWNKRSFELAAIAWEDMIRPKLKKANSKRYSSMPNTRELTMRRYEVLKRG